MYELSRVRLHSIGPKGARYQDVTLDMRCGDNGEPSPATVLFLENGGGKTVLVRLIFSVILPGKRQIVGTKSTKVLEKFVLGDDVAHVALEWRDTRTGQLLVTGKVSEWRGHVVSTDSTRLTEQWYTFRPTATLGLRTLPFTQDGRIVTLSGFRDRVYEAHEADPALQVIFETGHDDWTEHLDSLRLDPELFRYQRKMNAGEGEAADAFTFKTDEAFVDWLLTAILPDEELRLFGDVVTGHAVTLAGRDDLMTEREFVAGALDRLVPLVHTAGEKAAAEAMHSEAVADAEQLAVALTARVDAEAQLHDMQKELVGEVEAAERRLDLDYKRLTSVLGELGRLVAKLRWEKAIEERQGLQDSRDEAKRLLEAWQATGALVRYEVAYEAAETIRALVGQQEDQAAPLLRARDETARRLVRLLLAMAKASHKEAASLEDQVKTLSGAIRTAGEEQQAAIRRAEAAKAIGGQMKQNIGSVEAAVRAAVSTGLLAEEEDVAEAANTSQDAANRAEKRVVDVLDTIRELALTREQIDAQHKDARIVLDKKARAADKLEGQVATARGRRNELAATSRLLDLLGIDDIVLDQDGPTLITLLTEAIDEAEAEQNTLRMEVATDQRVLEALGLGGLLPPAEDVSSALHVLADERITCWSGWQYLSRIRADEREHVLARYPHLVDGIVLNSGNDLGCARDLLVAARLLPRTVIAVGASAALMNSEGEAPEGIGFIVPPNPAMYDEERAEQEREEIQQRQDQRTICLSELETSLEADRGLRLKLQNWQRDFPPGVLDRLEGGWHQAKEEQEAAEELERTLGEQLGKLDTDAKGLRDQIPALRGRAASAKDQADALRRLADEHNKIAGWQDTSDQAKADEVRAEQDASTWENQADELRERQTEAQRAADRNRRNAEDFRDEMARVEGGGSVDEMMPVPEGSLDSLRASYRTAAEAYEAAAVGADLRAEVARLSKEESAALAALAGLDSETQERATTLLRTPQGGNVLARAEATTAVQRQLEALESQCVRAGEQVGRCESVYQSYPSQPHSVEPYGRPRDIPHGEGLIAVATKDREKTFRDWDEAKKRKEILSGQLQSLERLIGDFGALRESLSTIVPGVPDREADPFQGDVEAAKSRRDTVRQSWSTAADLLEKAKTEVRRAADLLAQHASDQRYAKSNTPVQRQMLAVDRERLPDFAAEWESALKPRLRVLTGELDQIERHRKAIIERLQGMVKHALGRLRAAQKASKLPAEFGDWSGLEFLRISFTPPDDTLLAERLGEVIDEAAAKAKDKIDEAAAKGEGKEAGRRDGLSILLTGVRASLRPKGVQVYMLKPDAVLGDERVRVSDIAEVFSGGQLLTAAIILYCTMAWLRASERGQAQRSHAGVLFLDNPIGRASAGYLLELQLTVAKKLGVQLIYTTGLFDTNALSVFPLIVRLRNDADLRAGMKYLRVDEEIRRHLPDRAEDETRVLTASRLFVRAGGRTLCQERAAPRYPDGRGAWRTYWRAGRASASSLTSCGASSTRPTPPRVRIPGVGAPWPG
jgi:hypothetical protein